MTSALPSYSFGGFRLDVAERRLSRGDVAIPLRARVFDTLVVLVQNHGRLVRKDELMRAVWGDTIVEENNLDQNISVLRKALGQRPGGDIYIETVPRQGYRFFAGVEGTNSAALTAPARAPSEHTTFLVQRRVELEALAAELSLASTGRRRVVLVAGEAGVGKTSLVQAFLTQASAATGWCIGAGHCLENLGAGEPYMPLLEAVAQMCRDSGGEFLQVLKRYAPTWLLQLPSVIEPQELQTIRTQAAVVTRERMLREMVEALEYFTAERPLILVLEDLHWCDQSTLDLLSRLAQGQSAARLLVVATYRPIDARTRSHPLHTTTAQQWILAGRAREVPVSFLSEESVAAWLAHQFGSAPPALVSVLHRLTDGNPLFVVSLLTSWLERGHLRSGAGGLELTVPLTELTRSAPESLTLLLDRHLQQLSEEERQVIEAAAVAGTEFCSALLAAVLEWSVEQVEGVAVPLALRGQLFRREAQVEWPDGTICEGFGFVHSLYQEIVYQRVPAGRRVRYHQQLGLRLESAFAAQEDAVAPQLAMHFAEARDASRAVRYHGRTAELALQRSAHPEAIFHLRRAMELVRRLPDLAERARQELSLQVMLAPALVAMYGFAHPEAEAAFRRAAELAPGSPNPSLRFPAVYGLATMLELRGNFSDSQQLMQANLPEQEKTGEFVADGLDLLACSLFHQGAFQEALHYASRGAATTVSTRVLNACHGEHPVVGCETWAALASWFLGYPDQALARARRALAMAELPGRLYSLAGALQQLAIIFQLRREPEPCIHTAQRAFEVAAQQGFEYRQAVALVLRGWALAQMGNGAAGIADLHEGLDGCRRVGAELDRPYYLGLLADVLLAHGDAQAAFAIIAEAIAEVRTSRTFFYEAELWRLRAIALLQLNDSLAGESLLESLRLARRQEARSLELRSATTHAEMSREGSDIREAHELLAQSYASFTEGLDSPDLLRAQDVLQRLAMNQQRIGRRLSA